MNFFLFFFHPQNVKLIFLINLNKQTNKQTYVVGTLATLKSNVCPCGLGISGLSPVPL